MIDAICLGVSSNRQDAVLKAVVIENISIARRDYASDSELVECPHGHLTRTAATEIRAGHEDARIAKGRPVQHEIRVLASVRVITHRLECPRLKLSAFELRNAFDADDKIGADIVLLNAILSRDDGRFAMHLEAGDMQFLNNRTQLHSRTEYEDWPEPERRRLLYRIWLAIPDAQPLTPGLLPTYKDVLTRAVRGGFRGIGITEATRAFEARMAAHHGMALRIYE